ncbi:MAG: hypothetical protein P8182_19550, partial [Deltaproteobacteria bacterium]
FGNGKELIVRLSVNTCLVVFIGSLFAALMCAGTAPAQQPFPQPVGPPMGAPAPGPTMGMPAPGRPVGMQPFGPPMGRHFIGPCIGTGCNRGYSLYVEAGVKYRNINTFEMKRAPHRLAGGDPGAVPFGPSGSAVNDPGPLALEYPPFPVSVAANPDPNLNGRWIYDDGSIRPRYATNWNEDVLPDSSLGHVGLDGNVGRFIVRDPAAQADDTAFAETSTVTWHLAIEDSVLVTGAVNGSDTVKFTERAIEDSVLVAGAVNDSGTVKFAEQIWAPYIELGYQPSNFFDVFCAISWFTTAKADRNTRLVDDPVAGLNRINDVFPFFSNRIGTWPATVVRSSDIVVADLLIFPVGGPVRYFDIEQLTAADQVLGLSETLYNRIDLTMVEFKGGGRSWFSVLNWGKLGFATGPLLALIPYTVETSQTVRTLDDILNPNDGILYPSGSVLLQADHERADTLWDLGWFGAADLAFGSGPVYGKASIGYDVYFRELKDTSIGGVENRFNPSGWSLTLTGGVNF